MIVLWRYSFEEATRRTVRPRAMNIPPNMTYGLEKDMVSMLPDAMLYARMIPPRMRANRPDIIAAPYFFM